MKRSSCIFPRVSASILLLSIFGHTIGVFKSPALFQGCASAFTVSLLLEIHVRRKGLDLKGHFLLDVQIGRTSKNFHFLTLFKDGAY